jgi:hypothetical protein
MENTIVADFARQEAFLLIIIPKFQYSIFVFYLCVLPWPGTAALSAVNLFFFIIASSRRALRFFRSLTTPAGHTKLSYHLSPER